jgi:hypothetical protein
MKIMACALMAGALAGCVTAQERLAQQSALDDGKCKSYGAQPGSLRSMQNATRFREDSGRGDDRCVAKRQLQLHEERAVYDYLLLSSGAMRPPSHFPNQRRRQ